MTEEKKPESEPRLILLTGATGYVGGRLLPALEQEGYRVRCLARRPEFLKAKVGGYGYRRRRRSGSQQP